jgi:UPF0716 protein FxsA
VEKVRLRFAVLAALFVVVPIVEIFVLIQIGQVIGPWWTILLLVADGVLGSWLVKHEGRRAWDALQEAIRSRRMPHKELADGALILVGGTLLLTPGFVTDIAGLFCVLPFTRPVARRVLAKAIAKRFSVAVMPPPTRPPSRPDSGPDVVRGDVID